MANAPFFHNFIHILPHFGQPGQIVSHSRHISDGIGPSLWVKMQTRALPSCLGGNVERPEV